MLLIFLYVNANPSTLSAVPGPTLYEKILFPVKVEPGYFVTSDIDTSSLSYKSNNGDWLTLGFSCANFHVVPLNQ